MGDHVDRGEKLTFDEAKSYIVPRVLTFATLGAASGISAGHYIGDSMLRLGPAWCIGGGVMGMQFFGGALALRAIRGKDDIRNYGASGMITSMSTLKYFEFTGVFRRSGAGTGAVAGVVGLLIGIFYKLGADITYDFSRQAWLDNRRHQRYVSPYREARPLPKRPLPRELIGMVPPLQEGMSFEPPPLPTEDNSNTAPPSASR